MSQYIDKTALVAEIERRVNAYQKNFDKADNKIARLSTDGRIAGLKNLLDFIGTLEVKEVDFEEEYKEFVEDDPVYGRLVNNIVGKAIAKHFFELGLNMQQNISVDVTDIDKVIEENGVDPNSKEAKMFKESYYMALEKLKAQKGE